MVQATFFVAVWGNEEVSGQLLSLLPRRLGESFNAREASKVHILTTFDFPLLSYSKASPSSVYLRESPMVSSTQDKLYRSFLEATGQLTWELPMLSPPLADLPQTSSSIEARMKLALQASFLNLYHPKRCCGGPVSRFCRTLELR
jgi:hypothetical protein